MTEALASLDSYKELHDAVSLDLKNVQTDNDLIAGRLEASALRIQQHKLENETIGKAHDELLASKNKWVDSAGRLIEVVRDVANDIAYNAIETPVLGVRAKKLNEWKDRIRAGINKCLT